jgi:hypothetical protein
MFPLHTVCSPDSADTSRPPSPLSSPQTPQPTSSPSPLTRPSSPVGSRWVHKCVDTNVGFCRQPRSRTLQDGRCVDVLSCRPAHPAHPLAGLQRCLQCLLWLDGLVHPQMGSLMAYLNAFCPGLQCLRFCGGCLFGHANELDAGSALGGDRCGVLCSRPR